MSDPLISGGAPDNPLKRLDALGVRLHVVLNTGSDSIPAGSIARGEVEPVAINPEPAFAPDT